MTHPSHSFRLHAARWIVPVTGPVIHDGAVLVSGGRIEEVGRKRDILRSCPAGTETIDHGDALIMPCLVNVHCHLELSWIKGMIPGGLGFSGWLRRLIAIKDEGTSQAVVEDACGRAVDLLMQNGTAGLGDTGNTGLAGRIISGHDAGNFLCGVLFREVMNPSPRPVHLEDLGNTRAGMCLRSAYSAHSVYTCSLQTIREIKDHCLARGLPFSIHCAESWEETEFVQGRRGPIAGILTGKGRDINAFFRPPSIWQPKIRAKPVLSLSVTSIPLKRS